MNFKEIRLIRLLIWVLFYLVTLFLLIFLVVIPIVKHYKSINTRFAESKAAYLEAKNEYDTIFDRLKALQGKHRKVIGAFENRWQERRFVETAKRYFETVSIKPVEVNSSDTFFKVYEINAKARMDSPENFYKFLEALPTIPYVIQADFPIAFRALKRGNQIEGVFRIKVYEEKRVKKDANLSKPSISKR